jgi:tetratricopeptide (TPR) repeat protein
MAMDPQDIERKVAIDRLLSKANVHRMRGEYIQAEDTYKEVLSMDQSNLDILELIADMIYARGQLDASLAAYKDLLDKEPGRASAETKYARVALDIGEREYAKRLAQDMLENPDKFRTARKSPAIAMIGSIIAPGVGQIYIGDYVKGLIILGAFYFSLLVLAIDKDGTGALFLSLKALFNPLDAPKHIPVSGMAIFFASVLVFIFVYAVIDAPIAAAKREIKMPDISGGGSTRQGTDLPGGEPPVPSGSPAIITPGPRSIPAGEEKEPPKEESSE